MINFTNWSEDERENCLSNHINTELLVQRKTLSFENIETDLPDTDTNKNFEVAPPLMDKKYMEQILASTHSGDEGRWVRTLIRTYMEGGRVIYIRENKDNFVATLFFDK